jgi:hypothetical protein
MNIHLFSLGHYGRQEQLPAQSLLLLAQRLPIEERN